MTLTRLDYQRQKARVIRALHGEVLEIGAGDGRNFDLLPAGVTWVGLEPDARRCDRLASTARRHGHDRPPLRAPAEAVPLPDGSVDGVLATVALCSVDDPAGTLAEIRRVLRPGGRFAFAEHVAAPAGSWRRRLQRIAAPFTRTFDHGCDPARDTEAAIRDSGLEVAELRRFELPALPGLAMPYVVGLAVR